LTPSGLTSKIYAMKDVDLLNGQIDNCTNINSVSNISLIPSAGFNVKVTNSLDMQSNTISNV